MGLRGPRGPRGPVGPEGDPGPAGEVGRLAPIAPYQRPNAYTATYLQRVAANTVYSVAFKCYVVRTDSRKVAIFYKEFTISDDGSGNVLLNFAAVDITPERKQTGAQGMTSASFSVGIAPGDPSSALIAVSGPPGSTCLFSAYTASDDGGSLI